MCTFETPLLFVCVSSLLDTKTIKDGGSEVILQKTHVGHVFNLDNCLLQKKTWWKIVGIVCYKILSTTWDGENWYWKTTPQQHLSMYPLTDYWYLCLRRNSTWGMLSERIGRRPILLGGLAATSIVYLAWTSWRSDVHRFLDVVSGHCLSVLGQCYYVTCELGIILLMEEKICKCW